MRLNISKSKHAESFYAIETVVVNGKRTTRVVEKLGTKKEWEERFPGQDVYALARAYVQELTRKREEGIVETLLKLSNSKYLSKGQQQSFQGGYLFLQKIYYQLKLQDICQRIADQYAFEFDLNAILSRLIYTRVLSPSSKASAFESCQHYLEPPDFELHHIYRALDLLAKESDFIQSELYKNSLAICERNTKILYYDCTNFYFEIEEAWGYKQYGHSKENRPNPIVQMGLFLDGSGMPLTFSITPGNTNEQTTLRPLEKTLLKDFELSQFVVCTDAGLSSKANRRFNTKGQRAYVTTQSLKKLKEEWRTWALSPLGWKVLGEDSQTEYDLNALECTEQEKDTHLFYKQLPITDGTLEEFLLVSYSPKYRAYQRHLRSKQIARAQKHITQPSSMAKKRANDPKRFIRTLHCTEEGELAERQRLVLDEEAIAYEEQFDGFYAVCTNLEGNPEDVIRINQGRWEIEKAFRTLKTEFKSRPVYLQKDERIFAHFITCFIALLIYRILAKKVQTQFKETPFSSKQMLETLQGMSFLKLKSGDFVPTYTRTDMTDALHEVSGFRTDTELVSQKCIRNVIKQTKL
ncbi:MAG: IS1634 family transposase [Saccharofermentanales bacterium]|jgi:transposase